METNNNNNNESRVSKIFKSVKEAFSFAWKNKDKKCKVRSKADVFTVSYLNAFNSEG